MVFAFAGACRKKVVVREIRIAASVFTAVTPTFRCCLFPLMKMSPAEATAKHLQDIICFLCMEKSEGQVRKRQHPNVGCD